MTPYELNQNNLIIERSEKDALLYYSFQGKSQQLHVLQGDIIKLYENFSGIINKTDYQIIPVKTNDGIPTYQLKPVVTQQIIRTGGGGGGGRGISGIRIQDEGIQFGGTFITLNFEGANVTVTDDGGGEATITVGGGGMITGGGTLNRIAMFTGATTIGDSPFLRSGSDVTADGFVYFNSGNGIDVVASGGADVLNIGTTNADVINYGYAGTTHNMNGTVFNVFTTNLNVTDKIITLNDGGAAGSGGSAGFEIEEAGVATGYFIQNAGRTGFDFKASSNASVVTLSFIGVAGNQTMTVQNASGTIAYLSDIPVNAFVQNGNSFGANAVLGTNDAFDLSFETSGTTRSTISAGGLWGINRAVVAGTLLSVQGTGTTSATYIADFYNSTPTLRVRFRDDGHISAGDLVNRSLTIGFGAGFITGVMSNTYLGISVGADMTTGAENTGVGTSALEHNTIGSQNTAVGAFALRDNTADTNTAVGYFAMNANTTGIRNTAIGLGALRANTDGSFKTVLGANAYRDNTAALGEDLIAGYLAMFQNTSGYFNTVLGHNAGFSSVTGNSNIFIGHNAGFRELGDEKLFIDNRSRADESDGRAMALVYGKLGATTPVQSFNVNGNSGIGLGITDNTFGTSADFVLGIRTGATEVSTSPADMIQMYSVDISAGNASLGLRTEQAVNAVVAEVATNYLFIRINGVTYKMLLST